MFFARTMIRVAVTLLVVVAAIILGMSLWETYMISPWTRDGRVRVYVVAVAPEVEGTVVDVPVRDNQFVHKGDRLFTLDQARFELAVRQARSTLAKARNDLAIKKRNARRRMGLGGIVSVEEQQVYETNVAIAQASVDEAQVALDTALLNLQRSVLYAPVNGYITNLNLRPGNYARPGQAVMSVVDADSFWVNGYFEETKLKSIHPGDKARVKLMGYEDIIPAHVVSIARGINDQNGAPGQLGLQDVNPIFTWVRLAQRIPVRVHLDTIPTHITLAAGMTCTVTVGEQSHTQRGRLTTWLQQHI